MEVILCIVIIIFLGFIIEYNICTSLKNKVKQAESSIDVFLNQRFDLIPNLVETVKGYANHENETLSKVIEARGNAISASPQDKSKCEGDLSNALSKLLMISESYPDLKADTQFINLQNQLQNIESEIEKSRRYYNGVVKEFNTSIKKVPTCIIASLFKFKEEPFFEIENKDERENVKVQF